MINTEGGMDQPTYRIIFNGTIAAGQVPADVRKRLSQIFKLDKDHVEQLLSGSRLILKRNLSQETALKYKQVFDQSGAVCSIERDSGNTLQVKAGKPHQMPEASGAETQNTKSDNPMGEMPAAEDACGAIKQRTIAATAHTESGESNPVKLEVPKTSAFQDWWKFWGASITGLLTGSFVFNVCFMLAGAVGLQEDSRIFLAGTAGVASWYFTRKWAREKGENRNFCIVVLAVALVMAMAATSWRYSKKEPETPAISTEQKTMSDTERKLEGLQIVMNVIQGLVFEQNVPFPRTQEDILGIIKAYRQVFPPSVRATGPESFIDEWGTPIHYEGSSDMGYLIRSAGPDKVHGTNDDKTITDREE